MKSGLPFCNGWRTTDEISRGQKNLLWGYAKEGAIVKGSFDGKDFAAISGEKGYFEVILPEAANLYNSENLPASPFILVQDETPTSISGE